MLNRGTICVIYKCKTSDVEHDPKEVVVRLEFKLDRLLWQTLSLWPKPRIDTNPAFHVNETEIALVNLQLSEQGARNKVYKWTETEKIEELLVDMDDSPDLGDSEVQKAVARRLAKMHSANIEG